MLTSLLATAMLCAVPPPALALAQTPPAAQTPAAAQTPTPTQGPTPVPTPSKPDTGKIPWYSGGLDKALAEAKTSKKLVFADFNASWCSWCMKMNREVFSTDEAVSALENVLCVSIDFDKQRDTADRYAVGKELPVVIWFNPDGTVRERIEKFQDRAVFLANTSRIKADIGTINDQRRKVEANGNDLDARFELYRRLKAVGDKLGADAQRAAIEKGDPQGNSRAMHHFKFDAQMDAINAFWAQSKALDPKQIQALRNFMEVETDPEIMWDGWMSLANTYKYYADMAQARAPQLAGDNTAQNQALKEAFDARIMQRDCLARAWRGIPQDDEMIHGWVFGYAGAFWDVKDELTLDDKAFLLTITETAARRFENDGIAQHHYARALFVNGKRDAAMAACEKAIEVSKATGQDPQNFEKTLEWMKNGGK